MTTFVRAEKVAVQIKLRPVGNSVGLTIPASELRSIGAKVGDVIEVDIKCVVRGLRAGWDNPALWQGAEEEPMLLAGVPESLFDDDEWVN